jgi:hypothetical protein
MNRTILILTLVIAALPGLAKDAAAGWGRVFTPPPPRVVAAPVVVAQYAVPATANYAPAPAAACCPTTAGYHAPATTNYYAPQATTHYAPQPTTSYYAPQATTHFAPQATTSYYAPPAVAPQARYYAPGGSVITTMPRDRVGRPIVTTPTVPSTTYYVPASP